MPAFDYSAIYDLYDSYCTFAGDVPFWVGATTGSSEVLELMAGTGRISLPLLESGVSLTCIESDIGMASVLSTKLTQRHLHAGVICADVRELPTSRTFERILLPFQGLSELAEGADRQRLFEQVASSLPRRSQFICTAHNPAVRARTLTGEWREIGAFKHSADTVEVSVRGTVDRAKGTAEGQQRIVVRDAEGRVKREHQLALLFSLPSLSEIIELGTGVALRVSALFGSYDCSRYDEASSPAIIIVFEKTA